MKSEEGNDSLDTFIRQAIGKESHPPSSRSSSSPVQWIQLLHALDQPGLNTQKVLDIPGWPLLTQAKMQKCEKCSREFWSPINYRRHIRVHRRSLNVNKEQHNNRDLLAAFWDKLSLEQTKELMSFSGVMLKDIPGLKIITALASSLHPPVVWNFPPVCVDAGSTLVDIIQTKPSRLPISSHELFSVLDDASEGTFLCAGTAESVQKYIFEGNTAKNSLELNNLVASTGFLFEQQLVKAWFADKDAEALKCQKLLVEEEEAAQRRQATILEKKRQKKLWKEQKMKEQKMKDIYGDNQVLDVVDSVDAPTLAETFDLSSPPDFNSSSPDVPQNIDSTLESLQFESDIDIESQLDLNRQHILENSETIEPHVVSGNGPRQLTSNNWQVPKSQRAARPRFNVSQNRQTFKPDLIHKRGPPRNQIQQNRSRVWTKKYKVDGDKNGSKPPAFKEETTPQIEDDNCDEVIIGSIPITLKSSVSLQQEKNARENLTKTDPLQSRPNRVVSKHWRPVSRGENKNSPVGRVNGHDRAMSGGERCMQSQSTNGDHDNHGEPLVSSNANVLEGSLPFCSASAKEFLSRRWKEAISVEHVKLVISSPPEPPPSRRVQNHTTVSQVSDFPKRSVLGNAENNQVGIGVQVKYRKKANKELKTKYIPKQKV